MQSTTRLFASFGVPFSIEVASGVPEAAWRAALPPETKSAARGAKPTRRYVLERDGSAFILRTDGVREHYPDARTTLDALEGSIALHVAAVAPAHIFVHAGVVGWRGRALLLPGRSLSGKSTLVDRLLAAGATYYSDEYAVLDKNGAVHAYPRPMSLRREAGLPRRVIPKRRGRRSLRVGWVVGAQFERGREGFALEPLSPGRTALLLLDNTVSARVSPERVLPILRSVAGHARGATGLRGEAREAVKDLLSHCNAKGPMVPKVPTGKGVK